MVKINILGHEYKIVFKKLETAGEYDPVKRTIYIDTSKDTKKELLTILGHETAHAYIKEMRLFDVLTHDSEEMVCNLVGFVLENHADEFIRLRDE